MHRFVSALLALVALGACQRAATGFTEEQRAQIEQQLRGLEDGLLASAANVDPEGFLSFFEQSEDLTFAEFGAVHRSWSTWEGIVRRGFARIGEAEVERCEWSDRHYQVLAPSVAVSTAVVRCYGPTTAGSLTLVDHSWSAVWAFGEGRWRIVNFAETYPPPEPER